MIRTKTTENMQKRATMFTIILKGIVGFIGLFLSRKKRSYYNCYARMPNITTLLAVIEFKNFQLKYSVSYCQFSFLILIYYI